MTDRKNALLALLFFSISLITYADTETVQSGAALLYQQSLNEVFHLKRMQDITDVSCNWTSDGKYLVWRTATRVAAYDTETQRTVFDIKVPNYGVILDAFSHDIIISSYKKIYFLNLDKPLKISPIKLSFNNFYTTYLSPDSNYIVLNLANRLVVIDFETQQKTTLKVTEGLVRSIIFDQQEPAFVFSTNYGKSYHVTLPEAEVRVLSTDIEEVVRNGHVLGYQQNKILFLSHEQTAKIGIKDTETGESVLHDLGVALEQWAYQWNDELLVITGTVQNQSGSQLLFALDTNTQEIMQQHVVAIRDIASDYQETRQHTIYGLDIVLAEDNRFLIYAGGLVLDWTIGQDPTVFCTRAEMPHRWTILQKMNHDLGLLSIDAERVEGSQLPQFIMQAHAIKNIV